MFVAAAFHELCHYAAVRVCGGVVYSIYAGARGTRMHTDELSNAKRCFCSMAGPIGSICLLLLARWFPRIAICGLLQGLYNLLPVYPLDGGQAVQCVLLHFLPQAAADRAAQTMEYLSIAMLVILGMIGSCILRLGILPLSGAFFVSYRVFREKYLANRS